MIQIQHCESAGEIDTSRFLEPVRLGPAFGEVKMIRSGVDAIPGGSQGPSQHGRHIASSMGLTYVEPDQHRPGVCVCVESSIILAAKITWCVETKDCEEGNRCVSSLYI